ncbi:LacI family DNA-binding transcriptional regulator [Pararhizobium gei]|uniref:LacI family DNA-binding transcriptional regulator n=1 Tax=Pararhizobium gei TaxID=1395951 RepID=UPI0023DC353B|nr:LacI family DNA-binding transcriptional regulator [Rhizobium gei]
MEKIPAKTVSVTVADVAHAAGVSKATAARVLGGYGTVSDKVREAVKRAAQALDYRPNELARSMTTGRSGTIGVVVGDIENPFFGSAVRGITDVARLAGFNVILANSGESLAAEKAAVKTLIAKQVDGLIISPAKDSEIEHLREAERSGRPLALLDRAVARLDVDTVTTDDFEAAQAITRLLIGQGHRRIAYLTACDTPDHCFSQLSDIYTSSVRLRIEAFIGACRDAAIPDAARWVRVGAVNPQAIRAIVTELFNAATPPTAIIASDSLIGLEVFKAVREMGIALPGDLSLISFHDADWTAVTSPPVTVVQQPVYQLGETVATLLIGRLKGETGPARTVVLPTRLIERASVGKARLVATAI